MTLHLLYGAFVGENTLFFNGARRQKAFKNQDN